MPPTPVPRNLTIHSNEAGTKADVDRNTAKKNPENAAEDQRSRSELFELCALRYIRFKACARRLGFCDGSQSSSSRAEAGPVAFRRPMILRGNEEKQ